MATNNVKTAIINQVVEVAVKRNISAWKPGQARQNFESTATTYGQLKQELIANGFSLSDVRVTEGNTQIDLVNDDALLPTNISTQGRITNDLVIIMTPQTKIKSGAVDPKTASYKEMKAEIKEVFSDPKAKAHFGNYTQMSTADMRTHLASWYKKQGKSGLSNKKSIKAAPKTVAAPSKKDSDKLNKVKENLENKNYNKTTPEVVFKEENYNQGIQHILYGITLLQNETFEKTTHNLPTDEEIEAMAKKCRN